MQVKLTDFYFAIEQNPEGYRRFSDVGPFDYKCPEFFNLKGYRYNQDEWSFGVVMYKLLCGTFPFKGLNERLKQEAIVEC